MQKLATEDQVSELARLIQLLHIQPDITGKWLAKSSAENFNEMPFENIQKCIELLKSRIEKGE